MNFQIEKEFQEFRKEKEFQEFLELKLWSIFQVKVKKKPKIRLAATKVKNENYTQLDKFLQ
jgi:hypothetical protein